MDKHMRNKPVITVFMAVYNGSRYLKQAIDSVLSQTFSDFELLIINDGSTDNSAEIIDGYSDSRIRVLHNDGNKGLVFTRSRGVLEASGEYFAILDCDDIAVSNRLEMQYDFFCKNPDVALCSGRALLIDENNNSLKESPIITGDKNVSLLFGNFLINSAVMIKTDVIKSVGSYRANAPAEDYDLGLRISENYQIATIDNILVKYRIHENNISLSNLDGLQQVEKNILSDFHSRLKIESNKKRVELHHSLISGKMNDFSIVEYNDFLVDLIKNVNLTNKYNTYELRKALFNKWVEVLLANGGKKIFLQMFRSQLYSHSVVSFKHVRRIFKKSVREFVSSIL
jgi:glycosyltransferase involved in cell wall biosynthesis